MSSRFERVVGAIHARREVVVERYGRRAAQATADVEEVASEEEEEQEGDEEEDGGADGVPRVRRGHDGVQAGRRVHEAAVVALPARRAVARAVEAVAVAGASVRARDGAVAPAVPRLALADAARAAAVARAVAWTGRVDQSAVGTGEARVARARGGALVARAMARAVARADADDAVARRPPRDESTSAYEVLWTRRAARRVVTSIKATERLGEEVD